MTKLYVMRHGITDWNAVHRLQGRTDRPLTADARAHLASLRVPQDFQNTPLFASPLVRARDTAKLVFKRNPQIDTALTEMNWGDFEGQKGADLIVDDASGYRHVEDWGWDFRPPNGETPAEVLTRLSPFLSALTQDSIAVVHMGVIRVLLAQAHGYAFNGPAPFRIKRDRLYGLTIANGHAQNPMPEIRLRPAR